MPLQRPSAHFRGDIEGLRAVAALSILIFHANTGSLPGGFVGVDMFFVISGYLITASICREFAEDKFSVGVFYARRIRRLYPALVTTIVLTILASFFLLFPRELREVSRSALATIFYISNFYFASKSDYFADGLAQPLLHTWSLGVEEQFYLLYPLLILAILKTSGNASTRRLVRPLLALTLASLVIAEIWVRTDPTSAFFASPARFWELALGGLVAVLPPIALSRPISETLSIASVIIIVGALLLFSDATPVPGIVALVPALSMAILIKAGETPTSVRRMLSVPPLRHLGRISYSLYLVHWPLIVLLQANSLSMPARHVMALSVFGSLVLAWLLHTLVEAPARRVSASHHRRRIFVAAALSTAGVAALVGIVLVGDGFRERFPGRARQMIAYLEYDPRSVYRSGRCLMNAEAERLGTEFNADLCIGKMSPNSARVLLIGDSHAAQYYRAIRDNYPDIQLAQITATGCRPLLHPTGAKSCIDLMDEAFRKLITTRSFDTVLLAGRWGPGDLGGLYETAEYTSRFAARVYVLGPLVEYRMPLPRLLAFSYLDGKLDDSDGDEVVDHARRWTRAQSIDEKMARLIRPLSPRVRYLSVLHNMCRGGDCTTLTRTGIPVQFDYGHLTYEGSMELIRSLKMTHQLTFTFRPPGLEKTPTVLH